jgi:uncharacterized membrane protein YcaP (DUF421 family)
MDWFIESSWKTVVAFTVVLSYARLLGKEQIGHLTFYDYVVGITFCNLAASLALAPVPEMLGIFWQSTLFVGIAYFLGFVTLKSRQMRKIIEGEPVIVIHNGKILEHGMRKMRYNTENLLTQLRDKGIFNIADVEYAILETNGCLSVLPHSQKRPVTPQDLQLPTQYEGVPSEIIVKGKVIYPNLEQNNLDEQWLISALNQKGINDPSDVFYASLDTSGNLYIDLWRDDLQYPVDVTDCKVPD